MKTRLRNFPMLYKFLISFAAVLFVPLLLLGITGYNQLVKIVNHQVEVHHRENLNQLMDSVDSKLVDMNVIAGQIASNPDLTPYAIGNYFYSSYKSAPLSDYMLAKNYLHELLLYIRGDQYLYSSSTTYRLPVFTDDIYRFAHWDKEQFQHDINNLIEPELRPEEEVTLPNQSKVRFITYLVPIPLGTSHPYGTVIFLIKAQALLSFISDNQELKDGNTVIYDQNQRFITAYKEEAEFMQPGMYEKITANHRPFAISKFGDTDMFVSYIKSPQTGWTYIQLLPVSKIMQPINDAANRWIWTFSLILLIGSLAIYAAVSYNYRPVKKLISTIEPLRRVAPKRSNELEMVGSLLLEMAESNKVLERKVDQSRSAMREHLLSELLKGAIDSLDDWNEWGAEVDLRFAHERICVAMVEANWLSLADKPLLIEWFEARMSSRVRGYSKESLEEHRIIIILSTDYTAEQLNRWLKAMHRQLCAALGKPVTIGAGNLYGELTQAGRSFIEASTAIDYQLIKGSNRLIMFKEVVHEPALPDPFPRQELDLLSLLIRQGMTTKVSEAVREVAARIKLSSVNLAVARIMCYDVILTVMKTVFEIRLEYPQIRTKFPDVLNLMNFNTVEELSELIIAACVDLSSEVGRQKTNEPDQAIDRMIEYIRGNYQVHDFSIQKMADYFSLSMSYLSRLFKEKTGRTVLDYVNQVRIEQAKVLLRNPRKPIKEIVKQVGYHDASSFTRKFKTIVGLTPGEYRKQ